MLVYRDHKNTLSVKRAVSALLSKSAAARVDMDAAVELLIELGELETGIADSLEPDLDSNGPALKQLRRASLAAGRLLFSVWRGDCNQATLLAKLTDDLDTIAALDVPEAVRVGVSEGYAFYALYPQMYIESAQRFFDEKKPRRATVVGLRNIGSSLSAAVAGTLAELGVEVNSYTVRPHGHPFDRRVDLAPSLEREWGKQLDSIFLIVDEGPGLSGSSLTAAAEAVSRIGIPDEQIVYFPAWEPDGSGFVSSHARERWTKHAKYTTSFERVWVDSGLFARQLPPGTLTGISGGIWRHFVLSDASKFPPVQPQHERVKFLFRPIDRRLPTLLVKFAGLGRYGKAIRERAQILADAGFSPRVHSLISGFLMTEFVPGNVVTQTAATTSFLERLAQYIAFVQDHFPSEDTASRSELEEMMRVNVREGLGDKWCEKLDSILHRLQFEVSHAVNLDARMMPHEWLETPTGWIKTDGLEHHDDHFYPGPQASAWDLSGASIEFALDRRAESFLLDSYATLTGDHQVHDQSWFYRIAYLAFRLGYTTMAQAQLGTSVDARRFENARQRYRRLLQESLARGENRM